jgi:hypothetical protein
MGIIWRNSESEGIKYFPRFLGKRKQERKKLKPNCGPFTR